VDDEEAADFGVPADEVDAADTNDGDTAPANDASAGIGVASAGVGVMVGPPAGAPRARVVLVDHDLTPTQARNLERATGAEVLDRTTVILKIFQRHARTREARLQVEIARLAYEAPRLRESGGGDRVRGGIGGKGAGESGLELDRRKIRDRIAELRAELADIERDAGTRRKRRAAQPTVALVGYTNAGKSSLFRALTGSDVYVADELFATLDTTVRALAPETRPRILVSDTVGFIKNLPHDLVASFRSTLEEAREAHLLLHVVDASDPAWRVQREVTLSVLRELGALDEAEPLLVMNKVDLVDAATRAAISHEHPDAFWMSAHDPGDVARLREWVVAFFERDMDEAEIFVPYAESRRVADAHRSARVLWERHDERGTHLRVRATADVLARLRTPLAESRPRG
jgi:GTP-binding protein HflX